MNWFLRVENHGGADLDVVGIDFVISDGTGSLTLPVTSFYRNSTDLSVFAGFLLKSGESWQAMLSSYEIPPSDDQREYRYILSETRKELASQVQGSASITPALSQRIDKFFKKHFRFRSREYEVVIRLKMRGGTLFDSSRYRFTLFESDVAELQAHAERFVSGDGITWNSGVDVWIQIPVVTG